jgi:Tfp pilus assembly protein PilX
MKKHVPSNKKGAILVIVMAVLVAFSLMVVALLQLGSFNEMETIRQLRTTQAHWLAEAGLERGLSRIIGSADYREDLSELSTSFPSDEIPPLLNGGSYEVEITRSNVVWENYGYTIISTGMSSNSAMGATAAVRLDTVIGPRGQQALIALGTNTSKIAGGDTDIDGPISVESTLEIAKGISAKDLTGIIDAGLITVNPAAATQGELPDPGPPTIDGTKYAEYTNALNKAASYSVGTTNNVGGVSGTTYINITGTNALPAIPANSTWVINGAVVINSATIGEGAKIVAKNDVMAGNGLTLAKNVQIFTLEDIALGNHAVSSGSGCSLLAMGDISCDNHLNFKGIIFAGGEVEFATKLTLEGTLIAGDGFSIKNATVTYNPNVFPVPNPIQYGNGNPVPQPGTWRWQEIP